MSKGRIWTDEEDQFLIRNYGKMPTPDIAKFLNRTVKAVREHARKIGAYQFRHWSKDELIMLIRKLKKNLDRTKAACRVKLCRVRKLIRQYQEKTEK